MIASDTKAQIHTWSWSYGLTSNDPEVFRALAVDDTDASIYAVGDAENTGIQIGPLNLFDQDQGLLAKFDAQGNMLWYTPIGGSDQETAENIAVAPNGTVFITGAFEGNCYFYNAGSSIVANNLVSFSGSKDIYIAAFDPNGQFIWAKQLGNANDELLPDIAADATGIAVIGSYKGALSVNSTASATALNTSTYHSFLLRLDLGGVFQWMLTGGSSGDDTPATIASDGSRIYVGQVGGATTVRWYNTSNTAIGSASLSRGDHHVIAFTTAGAWSWATGINDPTNNVAGYPNIAVGCESVYVSGAVNTGSTFPNGTSVASGSGNENFYAMRLNATTGAMDWVRTGTTSSGGDHFNARDITIGKYGLVHIGGTYNGSVTYGAQSMTSTSGDDLFVLTLKTDGSLKTLVPINSNEDQYLASIAADQFGGVVIAGSFESRINIPSYPLTGPENENGFVAFSQYGPRFPDPKQPSNFKPAALCSTVGNIDLSTWMLPATTGNATAVMPGSTSVTTGTNSLGATNGTVATLATGSGNLIVDLGTTVPANEVVRVRWRRSSSTATAPSLNFLISSDGTTWTTAASAITTTRNSFIYTPVLLTTEARYMRVQSMSGGAVDVDAFIYAFGTQTGGTWSGPGIPASGTFDASTMAGQTVPITYTVTNGSCSSSTTHSVTMAAALTGGSITSTANGPQCPGRNSGTLTLSGHSGTIVEWQASTDNFTSYTALANTSATYSFNNLAQTTSFQIKLSNGCGAVRSAAFTVQVGDNVPPVITTCPPARTIPVDNTCRTQLPDLTPEANGTDNCSSTLTWSQSPAAGTTVTKGVQIITIKAIDDEGNSTSCTVTITVVDSSAPVISGCPANITLNADPGKCSATYTFTPPIASDNCGMVLTAVPSTTVVAAEAVTVTAVADPDQYPIGVTTQLFKFTDASGISSSCSFTITVVDDQSPTVVSCPTDITMPATTGICGAVVHYPAPEFFDNCAYRIERTAGPESGEVFPVGATTVEHLATDSAGHSVSCSFNVIVEDLQAPVIAGCPSNIIVQAPFAGTGTTTSWSVPMATDNCGAASVAQTAGPAPGSFFPIGSYTIAYTASANGTSSTCSFTVTVIGNDAPTIACPLNQVLFSTQAACAPIFTYATPSVADDLPLPAGQPTQIDGTGLQSGSAFPVGSTPQSWRVMDSNGNSTTCMFTVQVIDTIRPTFVNCPTDVLLNATAGQCGASHTYATLTAVDNCAGAVLVARTIGPASGSLFPIGTTLVQHRATDASGHTSLCSFNVTVVDNLPPTLTNCPADTSIAAEPTSCGARFVFSPPVVSDNCSATISQTQGPTSGSLFPIGDTSMEITATDAAGNSTTCNFNVQVVDMDPPVFSYCPDTLHAPSDPGLCGATVAYTAPVAIDNCSATLSAAPLLGSGSFFPVGPTSVTYTATDGSAATATCTFIVNVIDNEAPVLLDMPTNISVLSDPMACGAFVEWDEPSADDNCGATLIADHVSGTEFPVGTSVVTYSSSDGTHTTSASFLITVADTEDPVITCPTDDTLELDPYDCSLLMPTYAASALDNCAIDSIWQSNGPLPGDLLDGGTPTYYSQWSAVDVSGNTTTCLQRIDVIDVTEPSVYCPLHDYFEIYLDANCQAIFPDLRDSVTVMDCSPWTNVMWPPADTVFTTVGDVRMTMDIDDAYGNHVDNDHWISIIDTIIPSITCPSDIAVSTDPNTCLASISLPGPVAITDNCGIPTWTSSMSDGSYAPGIYPVTLTATDGSTLASCSFTVSVLDTMIFCDGSDTFTANPGECGVNVTFAAFDTASSVDLCGPITAWQSTHANGWYAAPDTLPVTYTVTDILGRTHDCNFSVTLLAAPIASITYGQPSFCDGPASTLPPTVDPVGGTFTSSTLAGAVGVDGSIDLSHPNATPGVHTVAYTEPGSCGSTVSTSITIVAPANAGSNAALSICDNTPSASLFAQLGGTPTMGGTWSGPSTVVGGQYTPASMDPGVYTYTISAPAPCGASSAAITVTEFVQPTASIGYPGTPYCKDAGTANVALIGNSGGTYSSTAGLSLNSSTGAVLLATSTTGTYTVTYSLPAANGCAGITATASIRVTEPSVAAVGYGAASFCKSTPSVNVTATGNRPGTYSATPAGLSIGTTSGTLNPSLSTTGTYTVTFTIPLSDGCSQKTATTSVTIVNPPNAGENSTLAICSNGNATSMLALLGGSPSTSGSWSGPSSVTGHSYNPATMAPGVYTYTVAGTSPCANASATVTVTEHMAPTAGTNGTLAICDNGAAQSLFARLGGTPTAGGTWSGPSAVVGGNYDPAIMDPGVYTYVVTGTSPCSSANASVTVSETAMPSATISYAGPAFCTSGSLVNAGLTGTGGGTFSASPALPSLNASNGSFNAGSTSANSYTITYTVGAGNACPQFQTSTSIVVNQAPWAGNNGSASVCTNGAPFQLFPNLTGSPSTGGTWYKPFAGYAQIAGGTVDPAFYTTGGTYQYIYVVNGPASCANDTAAVSVTYQPSPQAGTSATATVCSNDAAFNLVTKLGGTPTAGGTWSFGGSPAPATFSPGTSTAGIYMYTVPGTGPCANASATVTVNVVAAPNAGNNVALSICSAGPAQDLFALLGGAAQSGGNWAGASPIAGGQYDPATMVPGNYVYTVTGSSPCANTSSTVVVTEQTATVQYIDVDGDGLGDPSATITDCVVHAGYVGNNTDACPLIFGTIGSTCNDLNAATGDDRLNAVCACEGQLIDCLGIAGGTSLPGTPCNDNNALTENDTWSVGCQCAGTTIPFDCAGTAHGTASLDACGVCAGGTTGLVANASCTDCTGVVNGTNVLGSSCNDANASTENDTWNAGCQCAGTPINFDCAGIASGAATVDACGVCSGGTTGLVANASCTDCAGVINGTATIDACGVCSAGTTGLVTNVSCTDCAGVINGTAAVDGCGVCSGGTTGLTTNASCTDCAGVINGTAAVDACGVCSGGTTGLTTNASCTDCAGVINGTAAFDACGACSGGTTGLVANASCTDCAGVVNGTASIDACGTCSGGTTGLTANASCTDCAGVVNGTAVVDACGTCSGGTTGLTANASCTDCAGVVNGTAAVDACGVCSGGTTGLVTNVSCTDCAGVINGTAAVDACGVCSGGTTGLTTNASCTDCAGVINGTAAFDACGACSGGTTGLVANASCTDCAGVVNGTASIDACGTCSGGTTGLTANASCTDCAGVVNGTAVVDACGTCSGGTTGLTANASCTDCAGVVNGTADVDACGTCSGGTTGLTANASCTDCMGVVNGTNLLGSSCNDNNANTTNDTWNAGCQCIGTPINFDCAGVTNGNATVDACGVCSGGTTGLIANASCTDCAGTLNGSATIDACGICSGGGTGLVTNASCSDCAGVVNGTASIDACGTCSGGTTGLVANASCTDCAGVVNGTAAMDACGTCSGGATGLITNASCTDCAGVVNGTASIDACGTCWGGTTGLIANASCTDCAGVVNGTASIDACGTCSGGSTGLVGNASCSDCAGVVNGTAAIDACGICSGGTTGLIANASCTDCMGVVSGTNILGSSCNDNNANTTNDTWNAGCQCIGTPINFDCAGVANGTATVDACGVCSGGTTGLIANASCTDCMGVVNGTNILGSSCNDNNANTTNDTWNAGCQCIGTPINFDCAGVANGTAVVDACGICSGGTTGIVANASCADCAGVINGTAIVDACGICSGGTTGLITNASCTDCMGVVNGNSILGSSCNDGNTSTENDTWNTGCQCAGTPINFDCAGVASGTAAVDACGVCTGGTTGLIANASCTDCAGVVNGTAAVDACGVCSGGTTGLITNASCTDCMGVVNGTAIVDACGVCSGGSTGLTANASCTDCMGVVNGNSILGSSCNDGNTSTENDTWNTGCQCAGTPINFDCAGVASGTAAVDACGVCTGGTTGLIANASCTDCAGVVNGTAVVDACGICSSGTTGLITNASCTDCAGAVNGTAAIDACGVCSGGTTGIVANASCTDCAGVVNGTASIDACGTCSGGSTGLVANASCTDCLGVVNGTNILGSSCNDNDTNTENDSWNADCQCAGTPIPVIDCLGVSGGAALPGTACNDGNASTSADIYGNDCTCAGTPIPVIDCLGISGGTALPGTACNDGSSSTSGDVYGNDCICAGTPIPVIDCLGVSGGTALPGTTCDDNNASTSADVYGNDCTCAGTPIPVIDCLGISGGTALPGTACDDSNASTSGDIYDNDCTCAGTLDPVIDCLGISGGTALPGTACADGNASTSGDVYGNDCTCAGTPIPVIDCLGISGGSALPGTACDDGNTSTSGDVYGNDCTCAGTVTTCSSDAGPDQSTCGTTMSMVAIGEGSWSGPSAVSFQSTSSANTSITCTTPGVYQLVWTSAIPGCTATDELTVTFGQTIDASFSYAQDTYCNSASPQTPSSASAGGSFSAPAGLDLNAATGEVRPATSLPGTYSITHSFNGACPSSADHVITIQESADPSWTAPAMFCTNDGPWNLNTFVTGEAGGTWSGPGVTGNQFDADGLTGIVEITYTAGSGSCVAGSSANITLKAPPLANAGPDAAVCGYAHTMQAVLEGGSGTWHAPFGIAMSPSATAPNALATGSSPGAFQMIWSVTEEGCSASDTMQLILHEPGTHLVVDAGPDQHLEVVLSTTLAAHTSAWSSVQWTMLHGSGSIASPHSATTEVTGLSLGANTFLVTVSLGTCVGDMDTVVVHVEDLFIPQGISPNADGDNDRFEITGMAAYPGSELVIFNRWGQKVYENDSYANEWDGRSKNGQELPNDTYFYVLNLSKDRAYNGFVVIKR